MNFIFVGLLVAAFAMATWGFDSGLLTKFNQHVVEESIKAVSLGLNLAGVMAFFLGIMRVGEAAGLLRLLSRLLRPLLGRLFPEIPPHHPALGAMALSFAASALGFGNATAPLGIKAMEALDTLNAEKGTATPSMVLYLALCTANLTFIPTSVIAIRAAAHSQDPAGIVVTTWVGSLASLLMAILSAKCLASSGGRTPHDFGASTVPRDAAVSVVSLSLGYALFLALLALLVAFPEWGSAFLVPGFTVGLLLLGLWRRVEVYARFMEGAREGLEVAWRLIPYLVGVLVAIGTFQAMGGLDVLQRWSQPFLERFDLPAELIPMALIRPLSGTGAKGYLMALLSDPRIGPDSPTGYLLSTVMGSTETTFFVLSVYGASIHLRHYRRAVVAGLLTDVAGMAGAIAAVKVLL